MIKLLYCSIEKLPDSQIGNHLRLLPEFIREDITRCRHLSDRKSRLLGKLMLLDALKSEGVHYLLHELQHDFYRKPFLENWKPFNISHAGEMVVFCYGKHAVGVDLEKLDRLDDPGILRYFHPEEQEYIIASKSTDLAFYEIWVKKEALLKAIGIGITKGLDQFSCVQDKIRYAGTDWHLHKIDLQQQYLCYLCHQAPSIEVVTAEFDSFPEN